MASDLIERLLKSQRLASPPATVLRVLELAGKESASIIEVADAVAADPAIAAKLLKYANSPNVAPVQPITTVRQAVTMLGIGTSMVTALSFSLVRRQNLAKCPNFNFDLFWAYAVATAVAARDIMTEKNPSKCEEAFVIGLLSSIGKLALATAMPEQYNAVLARTSDVRRDGRSQEQVEFGTDSIAIGADLLANWGLPALLVEAVRHQADADRAPTSESRELAQAVQDGRFIADVLCPIVSGSESPVVDKLRDKDVERLGRQFRGLAGALDISLKDLLSSDEIEDRARGILAQLSMAAQTENRELQQQAMSDELTGIGNRKAFDQQLASEMERARRYGHPYSLLMMDIDHFKTVNDTHGHVAGDRVLQTVANTIRAQLRQCDFAARYGGEEFVVIAAETGLNGAGQLAERLRKAISQAATTSSNGDIRVTVSIGVVGIDKPTGAINPVNLLAAADRELYKAKDAERNCCCTAPYDPEQATDAEPLVGASP